MQLLCNYTNFSTILMVRKPFIMSPSCSRTIGILSSALLCLRIYRLLDWQIILLVHIMARVFPLCWPTLTTKNVHLTCFHFFYHLFLYYFFLDCKIKVDLVLMLVFALLTLFTSKFHLGKEFTILRLLSMCGSQSNLRLLRFTDIVSLSL